MYTNKYTEDCGYGDYYADDPDRPGDIRVRLEGDDVVGFIEWELRREPLAEPFGVSRMSVTDRLAYDIAMAHWDDDLYVVVYDVGDAYGGPEEGGWWFTTYALEEATKIEADDWRTRLDLLSQVRSAKTAEWKDAEHGERGSFGDWKRYWVTVEVIPQGDEPGAIERNQTRPHYC